MAVWLVGVWQIWFRLKRHRSVIDTHLRRPVSLRLLGAGATADSLIEAPALVAVAPLGAFVGGALGGRARRVPQCAAVQLAGG